MEIVTSWMEEGLEKGLRKAGRKGSERCFCVSCGKQIGAIDVAASARIAALGRDGLENLGEALLSFTSHADLDRWLQSHHA